MHNQKQEAHTMMWESFGEISAPFLKKRKGPRAHDEDVSHHCMQGGVQGSPDATGDLPLQSYGAATGLLARHSRIHIRNFE